MAITRAQVDLILIRRCGAMLAAADLDGTTVDGSNYDLADPVASALRNLGFAVSDPTTVTDSDLGAVDSDTLPALLDLAELRTLETVLGNLDEVDIRLGQRDEKFSQLADRLEKRITRLSEKVAREHGLGGGSMQAGAIGLGYQESDE
ncbi:MAG TPA: LytR C-terminal domain-containing protein [Bellilinea sp.]|nr:LytR C-terminal domain-containing protein [Bellilinea sp.]